MIEVQVPAKVILFGEWAVLAGKACVGMPLSARFRLRAEPLNGAHSSTLHTTNEDLHFQKDLLQNDPWVAKVWQSLNDHLPITGAFQITTHRDWQLHEGLGSSSALFLSLLEMRERLAAKTHSWEEVLAIFKNIPTNLGSGMDLAIQRMRTPIVYKKFSPKSMKLKWPTSLVLLHGRRKACSAEAIRRTPLDADNCDALAASCERFLQSEHRDSDWVRAITEHHQTLSEMGVIPEESKHLMEPCNSELGIRCFKSVGAGGMDGLLVWVENPERFCKLSEQLNKLGWYVSPYGVPS